MDKVVRVRVIPKAKQNSIEKLADSFKVRLTAPPEGGKANKLLTKLLADYFGVKKSQISIIGGAKSRDKLIRLKSS